MYYLVKQQKNIERVTTGTKFPVDLVLPREHAYYFSNLGRSNNLNSLLCAASGYHKLIDLILTLTKYLFYKILPFTE